MLLFIHLYTFFVGELQFTETQDNIKRPFYNILAKRSIYFYFQIVLTIVFPQPPPLTIVYSQPTPISKV